MANFCKYCGTPLSEEYPVCTCAGAQAAQESGEAPRPQSSAGAETFRTLMTDLKNTLLTGLKAPRQAGAALVRNPNKLAVAGMLAGIQALTVILLLWQAFAALGELLKPNLEELCESLYYLFAGMFQSLPDDLNTTLTYPVLPIILSGIALAALGIGISALGIWAAGKLSGRALGFADCVVFAAADSIYPSVLILAAVLFGLFGTTLQLLALGLLVPVVILNAADHAQTLAGMDTRNSARNYIFLALGIFASILVVGYGAKLLTIDWCLMEMKIGDWTIEACIQEVGSIVELLKAAVSGG